MASNTNLHEQKYTGWGEIGEDIVSEISGVRELAPTYRFFLDAYIDIPWGTNVSKSMEITINPIHL